MKFIKLGNKCPFCRNTSRKRIYRKGFFYEWIPLAKCYACRWCYGTYTTILGWFSIGIK